MTLRIAQIAGRGVCSPPHLWWHGAGMFLAYRRTRTPGTRSYLVRQRRLVNLGYARAMLPDGIAMCIMLHRVRRLAGSLKALT